MCIFILLQVFQIGIALILVRRKKHEIIKNRKDKLFLKSYKYFY